MNLETILDVNIESSRALLTPVQLKNQLPLTKTAIATVLRGRQELQDILAGKDPRRFIIVGPCSIHDLEAAEDYARKLKALAEKVKDKLLVVMRVYFEKPRTTVGWNILQQIADGNKSIVGMMLESNLSEGNQKIPQNLAELKYGVSVTDKCISWSETERIILSAHKRLNTDRNVTIYSCGTVVSGIPVRNLLTTKG